MTPAAAMAALDAVEIQIVVDNQVRGDGVCYLALKEEARSPRIGSLLAAERWGF